jgi:23S rRNA (adenine2030-N6)-methyltransferase
MNYRHAFHAGGFADVLKHIVLARILVHLSAKPTPFRVIDTHAGAGLYDLAGPEASRTGEWRRGIARLRAASLAAPVRTLLAPYLDAVASYNRDGRLVAYPGSPLVACALMRPQDRLIACEIEPAAARALADRLRRLRRGKVIAIDGWMALTAYLPPRERRGLVLVDPAFEQANELSHIAEGIAAAYRKWAQGIYLVWYPIKDRRESERFARNLKRLPIEKMLRAEIETNWTRDAALGACGVVIVNPPWTLESELAVLLPALSSILSDAGRGGLRLDWLAREK